MLAQTISVERVQNSAFFVLPLSIYSINSEPLSSIALLLYHKQALSNQKLSLPLSFFEYTTT